MKGKQLYLFGFGSDHSENKVHSKVIFHFDTLVLSCVIVILLLALSFSLGVERGKKVTLANLGNLEKTPLHVSNSPQTGIAMLKEVKETIKKEETQAKTQRIKEKELKNIEKEKKNRFQIQVATFKQKNTAKKAAKLLQKNGYPVSIIERGSYSVVYVGDFSNEIEAKNNLAILRKKYKDCILRRL